MRNSTTALLAALIVARAAFAATNVVHTAAEIHALPDAAFAHGVEFDLTGTVALSPYDLNFLLKDDTGGVYVKRHDGEPLRPGDIVRVTGTARHDRDRPRMLVARQTVRLGSVVPPKPIDASAERIASGDCDWQPVCVKGVVRDAFRDEIDPRWWYVVLNCGTHVVYAAFNDPEFSESRLAELIDAVVTVKGACMPLCGGRRIFFGHHVMMSGFSDVEIVEPALANPFDAPLLDDMLHSQPNAVFGMKRRRVIGSVIAVWRGDRFLLETDNLRIVRAEIAHGGKLPSYGDGVEVVGFPETDLYRVNLSRAVFRHAKANAHHQIPQHVAPADILTAPNGKPRIDTEYHGRTIKMQGFVRHLPSSENGKGRLSVECDGYLVPVETGVCWERLRDVMIGTELEITGVCVFDIENWRPPASFPRIDGFLLVPRKPGDVEVLSRPPWWTPGRLIAVIGALLSALGGIAVWNRMLNRIVERRTRELMKERLAHDGADLKVEERTRLAVELHDTLAQNLTGISLQIDAAQMAAEENPNSVMPYLETARRKMQNCRENLRNCLWDLRSRAFEEKSLAEAIRKTIAPHVGKANVHVDMDVPCRKLSDNAIHAVLCIARELVVNAIYHGKAAHVKISGFMDANGISFTVSDDGMGFDPSMRPGLSEGHFGLQGVSERARRLNGMFEIESAPGRGTTATLRNLNPDI